jgi:tetratricopeptide (TPR) repeat protein
MIDEAAKKYAEAAELHYKKGNFRSQALALSMLSFCYRVEEKFEDALFVLYQADSIITTMEDCFSRSIINNSIGLVYEERQEYDTAESYYLKSLDLDTLDESTIYYNLSILYAKKGDREKSNHYLEKAGTDWDKDAILYQQFLVEKSEENFESALHYLEQFMEISDSIRMNQNKNQIHELEKKYDKMQAINEKDKLEKRIQRLFIISLLLFVLLSAAFLLYRYWKNKMIRVKQNEIICKNKEYHKLLAELREKDRILYKNTVNLSHFFCEKIFQVS